MSRKGFLKIGFVSNIENRRENNGIE